MLSKIFLVSAVLASVQSQFYQPLSPCLPPPPIFAPPCSYPPLPPPAYAPSCSLPPPPIINPPCNVCSAPILPKPAPILPAPCAFPPAPIIVNPPSNLCSAPSLAYSSTPILPASPPLVLPTYEVASMPCSAPVVQYSCVTELASPVLPIGLANPFLPAASPVSAIAPPTSLLPPACPCGRCNYLRKIPIPPPTI